VNEELGESVARYPRRFAAFATLPVADPQAGLIEHIADADTKPAWKSESFFRRYGQ
jgi:predicted TIM-barrel fold metal-dependent hydrolase